jgi:hypothetical protein
MWTLLFGVAINILIQDLGGLQEYSYTKNIRTIATYPDSLDGGDIKKM